GLSRRCPRCAGTVREVEPHFGAAARLPPRSPISLVHHCSRLLRARCSLSTEVGTTRRKCEPARPSSNRAPCRRTHCSCRLSTHGRGASLATAPVLLPVLDRGSPVPLPARDQ